MAKKKTPFELEDEALMAQNSLRSLAENNPKNQAAQNIVPTLGLPKRAEGMSDADYSGALSSYIADLSTSKSAIQQENRGFARQGVLPANLPAPLPISASSSTPVVPTTTSPAETLLAKTSPESTDMLARPKANRPLIPPSRSVFLPEKQYSDAAREADLDTEYTHLFSPHGRIWVPPDKADQMLKDNPELSKQPKDDTYLDIKGTYQWINQALGLDEYGRGVTSDTSRSKTSGLSTPAAVPTITSPATYGGPVPGLEPSLQPDMSSINPRLTDANRDNNPSDYYSALLADETAKLAAGDKAAAERAANKTETATPEGSIAPRQVSDFEKANYPTKEGMVVGGKQPLTRTGWRMAGVGEKGDSEGLVQDRGANPVTPETSGKIPMRKVERDTPAKSDAELQAQMDEERKNTPLPERDLYAERYGSGTGAVAGADRRESTARPKSVGDEKGALEDKVAVQTPYGMLHMPKSQAGRAQKMQDEITASPYSLGGASPDNGPNRVGYTDKEYASAMETARAREMARIQREIQPRASEADKFAVAAEGEQRRNERYAGTNPRNELSEWFKERQAERPNMSAPGAGAGSDVQREVARMRKQEIYAQERYKAKHSGSTKGAPPRSTEGQLYADATNKLANAQLQKGDAQDAKFAERERQQADRQLIEEYNARASEEPEFKKAFPTKEAFAAAQKFFGVYKNKKDTSRPNVPSFTEVRRQSTVINS